MEINLKFLKQRIGVAIGVTKSDATLVMGDNADAETKQYYKGFGDACEIIERRVTNIFRSEEFYEKIDTFAYKLNKETPKIAVAPRDLLGSDDPPAEVSNWASVALWVLMPMVVTIVSFMVGYFFYRWIK